MSALAKNTDGNTNIVATISSYGNNGMSVIKELETQKEEIKPVLDFYDKLVRGWQGRALRAEKALKDPGNQSDAQQKVFKELLQFALQEMETHLPVYNEVKDMNDQLEAKIRECELMSVKSTLTHSNNTPVELDFRTAKELLYKADALIELRKEPS